MHQLAVPHLEAVLDGVWCLVETDHKRITLIPNLMATKLIKQLPHGLIVHVNSPVHDCGVPLPQLSAICHIREHPGHHDIRLGHNPTAVVQRHTRGARHLATLALQCLLLVPCNPVQDCLVPAGGAGTWQQLSACWPQLTLDSSMQFPWYVPGFSNANIDDTLDCGFELIVCHL